MNMKILPYSLSSLFTVLSSLSFGVTWAFIIIYWFRVAAQLQQIMPGRGEGILIVVEGTTRVDSLLEKLNFSFQKLLETLHKAKINQNQTLFFFFGVLL